MKRENLYDNFNFHVVTIKITKSVAKNCEEIYFNASDRCFIER